MFFKLLTRFSIQLPFENIEKLIRAPHVRTRLKNYLSHFFVPEDSIENDCPRLPEHTASAKRLREVGECVGITDADNALFLARLRESFVQRITRFFSVGPAVKIEHINEVSFLYRPSLS